MSRFVKSIPFLVLSILMNQANLGADEGSGSGERKTLDQSIHKLLREVINHGADLYNRGDTNGCYRLYEGALLTIRGLAEHRPEWQKAISEAIKQAEDTPQLFQRAFVLRKVIDRIRDDAVPPAKTKNDVVQPK